MKLDEIKWEPALAAAHELIATIDYLRIIKYRNGEYYINIKRGDTIYAVWDHLDPLTAQAVLFHLLPTE